MRRTNKRRTNKRKKKQTKRKPIIQKGGNNEFIVLCSSGNLEEAKEYLIANPNIDVTFNENRAFRRACWNGHLAVAQWLYQVSLEKGTPINVAFPRNEAFIFSCVEGHLAVAQWLYEIAVPGSIPEMDIDEALVRTCMCKFKRDIKIEVVKWLNFLLDDKYIIENENTYDWRCNKLSKRQLEKRSLLNLSSGKQGNNLVANLPYGIDKKVGSYL
jgi:hypothetical protein